MFCALRARPRARRELYRVSQADLGEFRLGPRPSRLGLLAFRARKRAGGTAGRQAVRPLGAPHRLFAWTAPAWRRVPGCCPCTIPLAVPAQPRALRGYRHRIHRQRSEFDPAGPLVWPAMAIVYAATGAGVLILLPASQVLIDQVGWRGAFQVFGGAALLLLFPALALPWRLFSTGSPHLSNSAAPGFADEGWTLLSAMRHHAFWALFSTFFFTAIGMYALAGQVVAYLIDAGFPPLQAATAWGFSGVVLLFGMLGISWLDGIIGRRPSVLFS